MNVLIGFLVFILAAHCDGKDGDPGDGDESNEAGDTSEDGPCETDGDCSNGLECDGVEQCVDGECVDGDAPDCDDGNSCTDDECLEDEGGCVNEPLDEDGDGYVAQTAPDGTDCGGTDCDDNNPLINPGAELDCFGQGDNNCNKVSDRWENLEKAVDDIMITNTLGDSQCPSIVWTGSEIAAIWNEIEGFDGEIYFTRLSGSGTKIGDDIRIIEPSSYRPAIAWTGSEFGIVWDSYSHEDGLTSLNFAQLSSDGSSINNNFVISDEAGGPNSILWTGSEFGVLWHKNAFEGTITRISIEGIQLSNDHLSDRDLTFNQSMAWTGTEFGVAWDNSFYIYFSRITSDGMTAGPETRISDHASTQLDPSIAWNGDEFGVAWQDGRDGEPQIYFTRLSGDGTRLGSDIRISDGSDPAQHPSIFCIGNEYGVAWEQYVDGENLELFFTLLSRDGTRSGGVLRMTDAVGISQCSSMIWTGAKTCTAWEDDRTGNKEIYFAGLESDATRIQEDVNVSNSPEDSAVPSMAWNGEEFGVVWSEGATIYFTRVARDGTIIGPNSAVITDLRFRSRAFIAWSGSEFGLTWYDQGETSTNVYFARLTENGEKIGDDTLISAGQDEITVIQILWTGTEYGIVWISNNYDFLNQSTVYFARIAGDGALQGDAVKLFESADDQFDFPSIAWTGTEFGVTWSSPSVEIYFIRIAGDGSAVEEATTLSLDVEGDREKPSIGWDGTQYGVSWINRRSDNINRIYFTRLSDNGIKIGNDVMIIDDTRPILYQSVAWNGYDYGLSWLDVAEETELWRINFVLFSNTGQRALNEKELVHSMSPLIVDINVTIDWNGTGFGVVWVDRRSGSEDIYYAGIGCQ